MTRNEISTTVDTPRRHVAAGAVFVTLLVTYAWFHQGGGWQQKTPLLFQETLQDITR